MLSKQKVLKPKKVNKDNEVVKYAFRRHLTKLTKDLKTITQYESAIKEFEISTNFKNFKTFCENQAVNFIEHISTKKNIRTDRAVSKQLILHYTSHVRIFFTWLSNESGFRNINRNDIDYIVLSRNETRRGRMTEVREKYTVSEILSTIHNMPTKTLIQRRNKALISLAFLTTPRITALKDALIEDIKYDDYYNCYRFTQKHGTKNGKLIESIFMGSLQDIIDNVINWQKELIELGFDKKDPLFPHFDPSFNKNSEQIIVLSKKTIKYTQPVRDIFKKNFMANKLPYYNPHNFRHTMTRFIMEMENTVALVALDENVGHELNLGVLLSQYGRGTSREY